MLRCKSRKRCIYCLVKRGRYTIGTLYFHFPPAASLLVDFDLRYGKTKQLMKTTFQVKTRRNNKNKFDRGKKYTS